MTIMLTRDVRKTLMLKWPGTAPVGMAMALAVAIHPLGLAFAQTVKALYPFSEETIVQVREISNVASYQSANDIRLHVGLGPARTIQQIDVSWPSGARQTLKDVAVNQVLVVKEP